MKHISKTLAGCHSLLFFFLLLSNAATAAGDTTSKHIIDTARIKQTRLINRSFNDIYVQNLRLSSAGQEYFDPHKTLLVGDLTANFVLFNTPRSPVFFVASSRVNLRLFAAFGSPVKEPSYMPGGTFYFRTNRNVDQPEFFSVSYTHHSNGTEGPTLNKNGTFNTDSGKFTTNFYTITYHTGQKKYINDLIISRYDALGLELHSALVGLGYSHALAGKYGFVRVNGDWLYNIARGTKDPVDPAKKVWGDWQRIDFQFMYIADRYDDYNNFDLKKRLNLLLKYYYQFPFMRNTSLMAGVGYRGQDEYNIFFQDSYAYLTIGVAAGLSFGTGH